MLGWYGPNEPAGSDVLLGRSSCWRSRAVLGAPALSEGAPWTNNDAGSEATLGHADADRAGASSSPCSSWWVPVRGDLEWPATRNGAERRCGPWPRSRHAGDRVPGATGRTDGCRRSTMFLAQALAQVGRPIWTVNPCRSSGRASSRYGREHDESHHRRGQARGPSAPLPPQGLSQPDVSARYYYLRVGPNEYSRSGRARAR
jgi:hypothetical protein